MDDKYNQKNICLEQELTRRVIQGLSCEWENALWVLPEKYRESITKPLFCIRDMKKRLGCWSEEKREICLSKSLVFNHPWDAVCDVLRHEMAHQFAHEVLGSQGESMHGPSFQRACHLLRADPKANGDYKPLFDFNLQEVTDYMIMDRHMYASLAFCVNDKWFSSLTPHEQKVIQQAAIVMRQASRSICRVKENILLEKARKGKFNVYYPTAEEFKQFREATMAPAREYVEGIDGVGKEWVDKLMLAIADAEKELGLN